MRRAACLSPLPPAKTGVADYIRDLAPHQARLEDLTLYVPSPETPELAGVPVRPLAELERATPSLVYYHMGNNPHHGWIHDAALKRPGVLVLHDLVLHHFYVDRTLGRQDKAAYLEVVEEAWGMPGYRLGQGMADGVCTDLQLFFLPLFERIVGASRGVVVHNERAARLIRERVPGARVAAVPMGIPAPAADPLPDRLEARARLGLAPDAFAVGVLGFLTPMKRPEAVVRAFARLEELEPRAELAIVGEVSTAVGLERLLAETGVAARVAGYVSDEAVRDYAAACDVFVNLRYPTAGETSASLLRLMGWGKPVIVSDYAQFREIPPAAALHVPVGAGEVDALAALLVRLAREPDLAARVGEAGARHVVSEHGLPRAARLMTEFGASVAEAPPPGTPAPPEHAATSRRPLRLRAEIAASPLPRPLRLGQSVALEVRLRNTGDGLWLKRWDPAGGHVQLKGWFESPRSHQLLAPKALPHDVAPGQETALGFSFTAPYIEGRYRIVLDLEVAGFGWFHAHGSEALVYDVDVS